MLLGSDLDGTNHPCTPVKEQLFHYLDRIQHKMLLEFLH